MGGEWMTGKFATASALRLLVFTILLAGHGFAQAPVTGDPQAASPAAQPPAAQQPAAQQPAATQPAAAQTSGDQEASAQESLRRKKPKDYKNWNYNVGFGANLDSGTTKTFVRGGGGVATAGVARNANKYLGLRADFIFEDLPLRDISLVLASAGSASSYLFALTVDPVINVPVTKLWGGYVLFGPGYYHRFGTLSSETAVPGSPCNVFFQWWSGCGNTSIRLSGSFVTANQNEFGYNVGGGVTRKVPSGAEIYLEYRLTHGSANGTTTDTRPITLGVRW
jgi:opacity protein-like surface antigen